MPETITSLRRALRLVDPPDPTRPADLPAVAVRLGPPLSDADLAEAERLLGWPLPEDYRLLLRSYGPFHLEEATADRARAEFLTPARALEERRKLKHFLGVLAGWVERKDTPHASLAAAPLASLLPVAVDVDSNGRVGWAFYRQGSAELQQCHEKHGLETDPDVTLEDQLVSLVCAFARWDPRTSSWY